MKFWIEYEKNGSLKYIGHLDMQRTFQRAIRRANLPVAYSQGFNPRQLVTFAQALPVGITGSAECMDIVLCQNMAQNDIITVLSACLPDGLALHKCIAVDDKFPAPMAVLHSAKYQIKLKHNYNACDFKRLIDNFISQPEITALKKTKSSQTYVDIKPGIYDIKTDDTGDNTLLSIRVSQTQQNTIKPQQIIEAISSFEDIKIDIIDINRSQLYAKKDQQVITLMQYAGYSEVIK